jgi:hypothetical protein
MKMKSKWWVWVICITLPLLVSGFAWNARQMGIAAAIGGGLIILATFGNTLAPTANQKAYYDKRTGRRVHPNGRPYYSLTEDIREHGKVIGFLWFVAKFISQAIGAAVVSACAAMAIYGAYAAVMLVLSIWK